MKYSIVYSSETGNTKKLADVIKGYLKPEDCIYFGEPDDKALEADIIYCGFWTDQGRADIKSINFLKTLTNQHLFLFGTAGFGAPSYFNEIIKLTSSFVSKDVLIIGSFMCQGGMKQSVKERYLKMIENPSTKEKGEMLLGVYNEGLKHPNEVDFEKLKEKLVF